MKDSLIIKDLEIWTRIGVPQEEREAEQRLLVTVEMALDTTAAAKNDDVKKSINYVDVSEDLKTLARTERKTIERFTHEAAKMILRKYKPKEVTVSVKKFAVPGADFVELRLTKTHS